MAIQHVNRRGDTYYLHEGRTKTGKPRFYFSRKREGTLAAAVPPGYEVYEDPDAQVFLRKAVPRLVTDEEAGTVERGVREIARLTYFLIDVRGPSIVVHLPPSGAVASLEELAAPWLRWDPAELHRRVQKCLSYSPMMRFTLTRTQRFSFLCCLRCWFDYLQRTSPSTIDGGGAASISTDLERVRSNYLHDTPGWNDRREFILYWKKTLEKVARQKKGQAVNVFRIEYSEDLERAVALLTAVKGTCDY